MTRASPILVCSPPIMCRRVDYHTPEQTMSAVQVLAHGVRDTDRNQRIQCVQRMTSLTTGKPKGGPPSLSVTLYRARACQIPIAQTVNIGHGSKRSHNSTLSLPGHLIYSTTDIWTVSPETTLLQFNPYVCRLTGTPLFEIAP